MIDQVDLIRHLRFFAAVAEARHFGHAAQDLGMTQPPLSQGIQRLELHLGVRLFERDARGVRLTDEGQRLLPASHELLQRSDDLTRLAGQVAAPRRVRVGVAAELDELTPAVFSAIAVHGVKATPEVGATHELVDAVIDGDLDLALIRHPAIIDGLTAGDVIRVATRLEAPLGVDAEVSGCDLPLVTPPRHHHPPAHDQLIDELRRGGHSGTTIETPHANHRAALVAAGMAIRLIGEPGHPRGNPPLRLRVVWPKHRGRRAGVDHDGLARIIERTLSR